MTLLNVVTWALALSPIAAIAYAVWVAWVLRNERADEE